MRFAIFALRLSKVLRLPRESDARSYEVLHLSRKIIFPKLKICLMLQNATPLRKSAPGPTRVSKFSRFLFQENAKALQQLMVFEHFSNTAQDGSGSFKD